MTQQQQQQQQQEQQAVVQCANPTQHNFML
jgi:hypothetical protein